MSRLDSTSRLGSGRIGPEFDAFLFALIGEDRNGLSLSVASALARMDLDPWQEAAALAALPPDTATQRVAALFQALPDELLSDRDRGTMATRLIALLPRPANSEIRSPPESLDIGRTIHSVLGMGGIFLLIMLVLLFAQFVMAQHDWPTPSDAPQVAPSLTGSPQTLPSTSRSDDHAG
jgi:hypothetical protein